MLQRPANSPRQALGTLLPVTVLQTSVPGPWATQGRKDGGFGEGGCLLRLAIMRAPHTAHSPHLPAPEQHGLHVTNSSASQHKRREVTAGSHQPQTDGKPEESCSHHGSVAGARPLPPETQRPRTCPQTAPPHNHNPARRPADQQPSEPGGGSLITAPLINERRAAAPRPGVITGTPRSTAAPRRGHAGTRSSFLIGPYA